MEQGKILVWHAIMQQNHWHVCNCNTASCTRHSISSGPDLKEEESEGVYL